MQSSARGKKMRYASMRCVVVAAAMVLAAIPARAQSDLDREINGNMAG